MDDDYSEDAAGLQTQSEDELVQKLQKLADMKQFRLKLAERLSTVNEEYKALKERLDGVREVLIREIGGEDAYPSQCKCASPKECTCKLDHVSLKQLVRLKFQRAGLVSSRVSFATTLALRVDQARATSAASTERPPAGEKEDSYAEDGFDGDVTASAGEAGSGEGKDDGGSSLSPAAHITQSEQRIKQLRAANSRLLEKEQLLLESGADVGSDVERMRILKRQLDTFEAKFADEMHMKESAQEERLVAQEKIDALTDHIEKLMTHLKHEAAARAKAVEATKRAQRELAELKSRNTALLKRNNEREQLISELKEGTRVLEDQLRLMDERYIDLRGKLDWTKANGEKQVAKILARTSTLEQKWAMERTGYSGSTSDR